MMKLAAIGTFSNLKMCGYIFPFFSLSYKILVYRVILYEILAVLFLEKPQLAFANAPVDLVAKKSIHD